MSNVLRQNKLAVYRLKRNYGLAAVLYKPDTTAYTYDVETGEQIRQWITQSVRRVIRLPKDIVRLFKYDLSFIAANKNFTYGGFFGKTSRLVLIDANDLSDYIIAKGDYIVIQSRRYVVDELDKYDDGGNVIAYMLKVTNVEADIDVV